jgi:hypothetical protein
VEIHHMNRLILLRSSGLAAIVAVVAACGGAAATGAPGTGAPATGAPATQAPGTQAPVGSVGPGFSFTLPSEDKALEDILPDEVAGEAVQKASMSGASIFQGGGSEDMQAMIVKLGKSPDDMSAAFGGNSKASIVAFRVKGSDANSIYNAFVEAADPADVVSVTDVTVAGKSAKKVVGEDEGTTSYVYLYGDAVVVVSTMAGELDQQVLDEIFSKLP